MSRNSGIGTLVEEMIHHCATTVERGVVQRRAGVVEAGGNGVHPGPSQQQLIDRLGMAPGRRIDEGVVDDLLPVAPDVLGDRSVEGPGDFTGGRGKPAVRVEATDDLVHVAQARGAAKVAGGRTAVEE